MHLFAPRFSAWFRKGRLSAAVGLILLTTSGPALPLVLGARVFLDARACQGVGLYSEAECANAYQNSRAEFDERAPRFASRPECERYFHRCMIGEIHNGGRSAVFIPSWRGFSIQNGPVRRAIPVTDDDEAAALFQGRRIDRLDVTIDRTRQSDAQKSWQVIVSPPPATNYAAPSLSNDDGPEPTGPVKTYAVPPAMLEDLKTRERLYGGAPKP